MATLTKPKRLTLRQVLASIEVLHVSMNEIKSRLISDHTRPLNTEQMFSRWEIKGATPALKLRNLKRMCEIRGLTPLLGSHGLTSTYALADVLAAEAYANGTSTRRRAAW